MGSKEEMTRKEFLTLTFTLIGAAAVGCSDDNNNAATGTGGRGGTTGTAGRGGAGGTTGTAGTTGQAGTGGPAAACNDPLPEVQSASDHTHSLTIAASTLDATSAQTFNTGVAAGHMHMVTLQPSDLTTIKGGGSAMVTSTVSVGHSHVFTVSCH